MTGQLSRWAPDLQSRATWQVGDGVVTYAAWIMFLGIGIGVWLSGPAAIVAVVAFTVLAFAGLAAVERETAVLRTVRAFLALRQTPRKARAQLKRQRAALAAVLEQVQEWLEGERHDAGRERHAD